MNFDEKLKQQLESEVDNLLLDDEGLFERMSGIFKSGIRRWIIAIYLTAFVVGSLAVWTGYNFIIRADWEQSFNWGIAFIIALTMQGFIKNFLFMEANRNSIMREIKRFEIALTRIDKAQN
ncbi:MAG: hypothetical protein Q9M92_02795 [Enterobacterales bacterium]|nr:hypothetical protein [Enterobacterales bacterium]